MPSSMQIKNKVDQKTKTIRLDYDQYRDKVLGGWMAKFIGGSIGAPIEGQRKLHNFEIKDLLPKEVIENDDTDFQVVWLRVLQRLGLNTTSKDLALAWLKHITYTYSEYGIAMRNCRLGIMPPYSGWYNNDFFKEAMGCPIRADIWAFVFPANPALAAEYARRDGEIDHANNSVWAEMFWAAAGAIAFLETSTVTVLQKALDYVPAESRFAHCVRDCFALHRNGVSWVDARENILRKYGHSDMSNAMQNEGLTILALLYGNDDFDQIIKLSTNCGFDTDCTCGTACALYGVTKGASGLPQKWADWCGNKFELSTYVRDIEIKEKTLTALTDETCQVGLRLAATLGGPVEITNVEDNVDAYIDTAAAVQMHVEYIGYPTVGFQKTGNVQITVHNSSSVPVAGTLSIKADHKWRIRGNNAPIQVEPDGTEHFKLEIALDGEEKTLPMKNLFTAALKMESGTQIEETFGLAGECQWLVLGPYSSQKNAFEDEADIDTAYVTEPLNDAFYFAHATKRIILSASEDRINVQGIIPSTGNAVAYLYTKIMSDEQRPAYLMIGSNDAVKVWLNGQQLLDSREHRLLTPCNDFVEVDLQKGCNTLCIKIARSSGPFDVRVGYRERTIAREPLESTLRQKGDCCPYAWHRENWIIDLAYSCLT